jgi:hypothetical protein
MSRRKYDPECPGCLPVIIDVKTGQVAPDDHPFMQPIIALWDQQDEATRKAWHAVTCLNSERPEDLRLVEPFVAQVQAEIAKIKSKPVWEA